MKILRVCYEYPPPWDGLTPGPFEISKAQVEAGHEILFFAGGNPGAPRIESNGIRVIRLRKSWPTYFFGPFLSFDLKLVFHVRKTLKSERVGIVHFHGNTALWFNVLRFLGFFKKTPYVFHAHSSGLRNFQTFWGRAAGLTRIKALCIWPLLVLQDLLTVRTADAIITVSDKDRDIFIKSYKCRAEKITVIENGVNAKRFVQATKTPHRELKILMVAFLRPTKNLEKLLSVIRALAQQGASPLLTIVGRGDDRYIEKLKALSKTLAIDRNVIWKGYVAYPELPQIYAEHDLLLLASHSEGLPKVVLEALSSGLKVVSTRSFSVAGFLNEMVTWVNETDDAERIASEILHALQKVIDFERFRREYAWDQKIKQIDRVYAMAIAKRIERHAGRGS